MHILHLDSWTHFNIIKRKKNLITLRDKKNNRIRILSGNESYYRTMHMRYALLLGSEFTLCLTIKHSKSKR